MKNGALRAAADRGGRMVKRFEMKQVRDSTMAKVAAAFIVLAMTATAANCQVTGDKWIALCSDGAPQSDLVSCSSYLRGVADMVQIMQQAAPEVAKACIPLDKTANDLAKAAFPLIVTLSDSDRAKPAAILLWGAFMLAYPCR